MQDTWEALLCECSRCHECALGQTRRNVVFGTGSPTAEIMLVGEGPGANEDQQGVPFVGRAGQLLDDMLSIIGLDRTKVYITNIVKCRPPENRDPLNVEQDMCIGYLRRQIGLLRPKILVSLGRIAAMRLIDGDFRITRDHGKWYDVDGMRMMAVYHPSALLRDPSRRPETSEVPAAGDPPRMLPHGAALPLAGGPGGQVAHQNEDLPVSLPGRSSSMM